MSDNKLYTCISHGTHNLQNNLHVAIIRSGLQNLVFFFCLVASQERRETRKTKTTRETTTEEEETQTLTFSFIAKIARTCLYDNRLCWNSTVAKGQQLHKMAESDLGWYLTYCVLWELILSSFHQFRSLLAFKTCGGESLHNAQGHWPPTTPLQMWLF